MDYGDQTLESLDPETANRIISKLEKEIEDRDNKIAEVENDNIELKDQVQMMRLEYETQIETLKAELTNAQMQRTELQAHYDDAKEQLHELHGNEHEIENARKERNDAILQLQRVEQEYRSMTDELGMLHNENEQLRSNLTDSQGNSSKLQTKLLTMQKEKRENDQKFSKYIQDSKLREEALHQEIEDLELRLEEISKTTDDLRQNILQSEQEKMKMQNEFTEATMNLLTDDMNASNTHHSDRQSTMRLSAITSEDTKPRQFRSDSQFSVLSDNDHDALHHDRNSSVQFQSHRMGSGSIGHGDTNLLADLKQHGFVHDRTESQLSIDSEAGGRPKRHSRQLSIGATSDAILQKLRVFLSRELIGQVKTMLGEELKNINIKEQFDGMPEKLEGLLNKVIENQSEMKNSGSSLNEESLNKILNEFKATVTSSLSESLANINENSDTGEEIKNALNEALDDIREKLDNPSESLKTAMEDTMTMQMTALQVSMENQIEHAINNSVQNSMSQNVGKDITNIINKEVSKPLETIHETVEKLYEMQQNSNEDDSENESNKKGLNTMIDELGDKMEKLLGGTMEDSMQERMDKFMETFRKEVIPEFQAMFEQMDLSKSKKSLQDDGTTSSDDEKYDENKNEYEKKIHALEDRILEMMREQKQLKFDLREAATTKASALLRLQNLIDHLRFDNRVLQKKLDSYIIADAIEKENANSSWVGSMFGGLTGFGGFNKKPMNVNVSEFDMGNVQNASHAAAEYTAHTAANVVARAVNAGVNGQGIST